LLAIINEVIQWVLAEAKILLREAKLVSAQSHRLPRRLPPLTWEKALSHVA
jgi:hypothetical protein